MSALNGEDYLVSRNYNLFPFPSGKQLTMPIEHEIMQCGAQVRKENLQENRLRLRKRRIIRVLTQSIRTTGRLQRLNFSTTHLQREEIIIFENL